MSESSSTQPTRPSKLFPLPKWSAQAEHYHATPLPEADIPARLVQWVGLKHSMTAEIAHAFSAEPTVAVHFSAASPLLEWERECLQLGSDHNNQGFARHISLNIEGKPVLAARSVVSESSAIKSLLSELQKTPLARVLFEDPNWQRSGNTLPLICGDHVGRACAWVDGRTGAHLVVEEFFLF